MQTFDDRNPHFHVTQNFSNLFEPNNHWKKIPANIKGNASYFWNTVVHLNLVVVYLVGHLSFYHKEKEET